MEPSGQSEGVPREEASVDEGKEEGRKEDDEPDWGSGPPDWGSGPEVEEAEKAPKKKEETSDVQGVRQKRRKMRRHPSDVFMHI